MNLKRKVDNLLASKNSYWSERITSQLLYAYNLSCVRDHRYSDLVNAAANSLLDTLASEGAITASAAKRCEEILMPLKDLAKGYKVRCVGHAHIDMNWMWGFQETAAITLDTFRTVLELMEEYPSMTFGQSQASTYRIIEEYAPEMLPLIRKLVHEGRWEVTASAWVEADKNMTGSESLIRHIQYTRKYLCDLLDIPDDQVKIAFEPDTFGHNAMMPEIYAQGGVRYMYHCRGQKDNNIYRWRAESGAEVLVYCEPIWYNSTIRPDSLADVPVFCDMHGIDVMLKVYGVGDHGGGPTRRDVNRILDMMTWPVYPTITFGTYDGFFRELDAYRSNFPVVQEEINFIFTGCYTSQAKIKAANRIAEARMEETEMLNAGAALLGGADHRPQLRNAWEKILFNHFHDILPGSGVADTREYALGIFQQAMAGIGTTANVAMRTIAEAIDTSSIPLAEDTESVSEGAGVGYGMGMNHHYCLQMAERGNGTTRIFHLFNPTAWDYQGAVTLTVWDWTWDTQNLLIRTPEGERVAHQILSEGSGYWGHRYMKVVVDASVPAFGYSTYVLEEGEPETKPVYRPVAAERREGNGTNHIVLDNGILRAEFDRRTMMLLSMIRKDDGREMIGQPSAMFRFIQENARRGMTSWREGDPVSVENIYAQGKVRLTDECIGSLRQWISFEVSFGTASKLNVIVSLESGSDLLDFDVTADFREVGGDSLIPGLRFYGPISYEPVAYRCDIPFGTIDRKDLNHDVPGLSFICAVPESGPAVMLTTDTKYGYRGEENGIGVNLIRASFDPDPLPEFGLHRFRIGLGIAPSAQSTVLLSRSERFNHPVTAISVRRGAGSLPMRGSLMTKEGDAMVSCVKVPEKGNGLLIRLADVSGKGSDYRLTFGRPVAEAKIVDACEKTVCEAVVEGCSVFGTVKPGAIESVLVRFAQ